MRLTLTIVMLCLSLLGQADTELPPGQLAQQLIEAAAQDFARHGSPAPDGLRRVRFGQLRPADGPPLPLLCGEFKPARAPADWAPFATLKTSGYEQWLGAQARTFCEPGRFEPLDALDHSAELIRALKAAQGEPR